MVFRVRDVCGGPELGIRLSQQIFGSLGVTAEALVVIVLGNVDLLVSLDDMFLGFGQIGVVMWIDVDDGCLGEGYRDTGERGVQGCVEEQAFLCHDGSPWRGFGRKRSAAILLGIGVACWLTGDRRGECNDSAALSVEVGESVAHGDV
jgi:hypothetical protein